MQPSCLKTEYASSSSSAGQRTGRGQRWRRERARRGRAYDYGVERLAAYSGGSWNAQKMEYVYDGRGSVAQEVGYNNSWYTFGGKIGKASVVSKSYSPFGELLNKDNINNMTNYAFNGESYDPATGMVNLSARQYEPALMRFSQRDILKGDLSIPLSLNRYLYCANDPVNFADFSGQSLKSLWNKVTSVAKSAAKAVTKVATSAYKAVTTTVKNVVNNIKTVATAIKTTAQNIVNTVKNTADYLKSNANASTGAKVGAVASAVASTVASAYNTYVETKATVQANNAQSATAIIDLKKDTAAAFTDFITESYGQLSPRNQEIMNNAAAKMKEMQANGASQAEIAKVFLTACREVGKNVGETAVEVVKEEIVEPTLKTISNSASGSLQNDPSKIESNGNLAIKNTPPVPSTTPSPLPMPGPSPEIPDYEYDSSKSDTFVSGVTKVWNSLEIEASFGFGLGASVETAIAGGSVLARSDVLVIKLDDGKFDIGRRQSAEAGYTFLFGSKTAYAQDYESFITGEAIYDERGVSRTVPIAEIGGYLIVGGKAGISINPDDFFGLQP